jgi:hypothetical protein
VNDGFDVVSSDLVSHARRLGDLADELRGTLDLARQVNLTGDAYGEPARQLAGLVDRLGDSGQATLRAGVEAVEFADRQLRAVATDYDSTETATTRNFGGSISDRLDGEV